MCCATCVIQLLYVREMLVDTSYLVGGKTTAVCHLQICVTLWGSDDMYYGGLAHFPSSHNAAKKCLSVRSCQEKAASVHETVYSGVVGNLSPLESGGGRRMCSECLMEPKILQRGDPKYVGSEGRITLPCPERMPRRTGQDRHKFPGKRDSSTNFSRPIRVPPGNWNMTQNINITYQMRGLSPTTCDKPPYLLACC